MAVKGFSSSNYLSVADHADFDLPNGDWTELIILRPDSVSGTFCPISNGAAYGGNTRQWFLFDNSLELIVNGNDGSSVNLSASTWYLVCAKRSGTSASIRVVEMGTTTVSAGSTFTLSAASSPSSSNYVGRENDTTANPWNGAISDWIIVPGTAISDSDLQDIATGTAIDSFGWYSSNATFWAIPDTSSNTDHIGSKTVTVNGTLTTETDPGDLVRFGATTEESTLTAAGAGAASFAGTAVKPSVLTAAGAGAASFVGAADVESDWTAAGAGAFSGVGAVDFESELTAAGAGAASFASAAIKESEWTAAGAGAASFDALSGLTELTAAGAGAASFVGAADVESEWTAAGAGAASFAGTGIKPTELTAAGAGAASFVGETAYTTDLTAAGAGAATFEVELQAESELTAVGAGAFSGVGSALVESAFTAAGAGAASFIGLTASDLTAAGAGAATFIARTIEVPVTLPESNIYFLAENLTDDVDTSSATSTASGFSLSNVQLDTKSKVWRSTATTAQVLEFTWADTQTISAVALAFTNLSAGSTVQIEIFTNVGDPSPVYDSGALSVDFAYDPPTGFTTIGLASFAFGGGTYFSHLFSTQTGKEINITITSSGNPDGYIEVSRVICGLAYTPEIGASYGAQVGYEDSSTKAITDSGDTVVHRGSVKKSMTFNLQTLDVVDKYGLSNVNKNRAASSPVFVSMYENSQNPEERQSFMIYGLFDQVPATAITRHNIYNAGISITEV